MPKKTFLLELGTEELPPKSLLSLANALLKNIEQLLQAQGLQFSSSKRFAAPRRLGILIEDLDTEQPPQKLERRGPALSAAYDAEGKPTSAALGFAKSCGVELTQLQTKKTTKGEWLYYKATLPGKETINLLGDMVKAAVKKLPIAKAMRWGTHQFEFIRPVHWLLMLLGKDIVPAEVLGKKADRLTYGHRFHFPQALKVKQATDYEELLESKAYVIPDFTKRKEKIQHAIKQLASESNGLAIYEESLLDEVTAIVEYPEVLRGQFAEDFLQVPQEALIAAMQEHQKSFPIFDQHQGLLPYFIFVANIKSKKPTAVIAGNEKVMQARLSDAAFFYHADLKTPLVERLPKLKTIVFQEKLGDLYQRSERIAALSEFVAKRINTDLVQAKRTGLLCKCDLLSDMVYEFPELQGIMGSYYAAHDDEPRSVAKAIRQHYQPEFSGDDLPSESVGICVALADKLDLLVGIFAVGLQPSGDKDPFGLRRAAIGVLRILIEKQLSLSLDELIKQAKENYIKDDKIVFNEALAEQTLNDPKSYILDRLPFWYAEQGIPTVYYLAVHYYFIGKDVNLYDFHQRVFAVKIFAELPQAKNLIAANKRVQNILKKNNNTQLDIKPELLKENAEKVLYETVLAKKTDISPLLAKQDYTAVLTSLAGLQTPLDIFFAEVMVMVDDMEMKNNRLALLEMLHDLFTSVADIAQLA